MIVRELIENLLKAPQDYGVITEGYDCDVGVFSVWVREDYKDVYLSGRIEKIPIETSEKITIIR